MGDAKPELRAEGQLLQAMLAHWIHEDNLYWAQIRHLFVLQLAVAAAWWNLRTTILGGLLMFAAFLISAFLYWLAAKIQLNRDVNLDAIGILSTNPASGEIEQRISAARIDCAPRWGLFRFARHPLGTAHDEGKRFHIGLFGAFMLLNLSLGFGSIYDVVAGDDGFWEVLMDIQWSTVWPAVSAIAGVASAGAIGFAVYQLRFDAWLKAQEVFTAKDFAKARKAVFAHFDDRSQPWPQAGGDAALTVCRKMDELAHLTRFVRKSRIMKAWANPIARAWLLLEPTVDQERRKSHWQGKWEAFARVGNEAVRRSPDLVSVRKTVL